MPNDYLLNFYQFIGALGHLADMNRKDCLDDEDSYGCKYRDITDMMGAMLEEDLSRPTTITYRRVLKFSNEGGSAGELRTNITTKTGRSSTSEVTHEVMAKLEATAWGITASSEFDFTETSKAS